MVVRVQSERYLRPKKNAERREMGEASRCEEEEGFGRVVLHTTGFRQGFLSDPATVGNVPGSCSKRSASTS